MSVIYEYDGTLEGLLTTIFIAFRDKECVSGIYPLGGAQNDMFSHTERTVTDSALCARVQKGIREKLGGETYLNVCYAYFNCATDKETAIYKFLRRAFDNPSDCFSRANEENARFYKLRDEVGREVEHYRGFTRFSQTKAGFMYAEISPKHKPLAPLMAHFTSRMKSVPFVIYDKTNLLLAAYDTKNRMITDAEGFLPPPVTEDEAEQRRLWKKFFESVAIKERTNPRCQLNMLPKRYRGDMTEFNPNI